MLEIPARIPPHNLDAERAVLGACLIDGAAALDRTRGLEPEDFYTDANRTIFAAMRDMSARGEPVDLLTLADELRSTDNYEFVGGPLYLATLQEQASILGNLTAYVGIVKDHAARRQRIQLGTQLVTAGFSDRADDDDTRAILARIDSLADSSGWPDPLPLSKHDPPDCPLDVLPSWLRDQCEAVAASTQTPRALAGMLALSVLSAATAGRLVVEVRGGWVEPPPLYTLSVLDSGDGKSPAFAAMVKPIRDCEQALDAETRIERAKAAERRRIVEERLTHLRKAAAKENNAVERRVSEEHAQDAAAALEAMPRPVRPRLLADNGSTEKIEAMLVNLRRLAVLDDEGTMFSVMAGRYSKGHNYDVFLKAYDAKPIRVDRLSREEYSESAWGPPLTMGLTVQPHVLRDIARQPGFIDRGLIGRFAIVMPNSMVGQRAEDAPEHPAGVAARYAAALTAMLREPLPAEPAVLRLAPLALAQLKALKGRLEPRLRRDGGDLGHMRDWAGKLIGRVARIAANLHAADHALTPTRGLDTRISGETMARAIRLAEAFLIPHAKVAYLEMGADASVGKAERIVALIRQKGSAWLTRREAYTECRPAINGAKDADAPLELLVDHHYLRPVEPAQDAAGKRGRKPTPRYQVNPKLLGRWNSANSANSALRVQNVNGAAENGHAPTRETVRL